MGCDLMKPVPPQGWSWHSGMRELLPQANLPQYVCVEALCTYAKSKREKADQTRNVHRRAGFLGLLEDSPHIAATPPVKPPGDFSYQECKPPALPKLSLSVETPADIGTEGNQLLPTKNAAIMTPPPP